MSFKEAKVVAVGVNSDEYHSEQTARGSKEYPMSPSRLKEFKKCPKRWLRGYNDPDTAAKKAGSLLDCLLLTPEQFSQRYAIYPAQYTNSKGQIKPWNNNSTAAQVWAQKHSGKEHVKQKRVDEAQDAIRVLRSEERLAEFIACSDTQVLVDGFWEDEASGITIPVRCLIDFVPREDSAYWKCLGDLKRTKNANNRVFSRWAHRMGYDVQAAFDIDLYVAATGQDRDTWSFICQESYEPWQCSGKILDLEFLEMGRLEYRSQLALYAKCLKTGFWPGYDDDEENIQGWSLVRMEPWMMGDRIFGADYDFGEEQETKNNGNLPEEIIP